MAECRERSRVAAWTARYGKPLLALAMSLIVTALVLCFADELVDLRGYGYAGVFVISLLGNATVIFPVPSLAVVFASGSVLNPVLVGLVAGVAEPLGELTGYMAGYGGGAIVQDRESYQRVKDFVTRRGFLTIFVLSAIPNPLFDLAGIAAGAARFPIAKFLAACWLGKTVKALLVAFLGLLSINWLGDILR